MNVRPASDSEIEYIEKRSRFIGRAYRTDSESRALELLNALRKRHYDATHNVYAYITPENTRFSDDGEPSGTAGRPVLSVLQRRGVSSVLVVVTRYFGGVLLGAGGLVRAYTKAAVLALDAAGTEEIIETETAEYSFSYAEWERVRRELSAGAIDVEVEYSELVHVRVTRPLEGAGYV